MKANAQLLFLSILLFVFYPVTSVEYYRLKRDTRFILWGIYGVVGILCASSSLYVAFYKGPLDIILVRGIAGAVFYFMGLFSQLKETTVPAYLYRFEVCNPRTYETQVVIEQQHIDRGNHANWKEQLGIAELLHLEFRKESGISEDDLFTQGGLFLVMRVVENTTYYRQLRLGEVVTAKIEMSKSGPCSFKCQCIFLSGKKVATEFNWTMVLIRGERPVKIPKWMMEAIGGV